MPWPTSPDGDMTPILELSIEVVAAMKRHPSGRAPMTPAPQGEAFPAHRPAGIKLTATDRCDACGGAAVFRVAKKETLSVTLDFCGHHWRKSFPKMADSGWAVIGGNPDLLPAAG